MGIKRKHKAGQIREVEFYSVHDNFCTRYQQALTAIDNATLELQAFSDSHSSKG